MHPVVALVVLYLPTGQGLHGHADVRPVGVNVPGGQDVDKVIDSAAPDSTSSLVQKTTSSAVAVRKHRRKGNTKWGPCNLARADERRWTNEQSCTGRIRTRRRHDDPGCVGSYASRNICQNQRVGVVAASVVYGQLQPGVDVLERHMYRCSVWVVEGQG